MNFSDVLLWGALGTMVLTTLLAASQGLGFSRMSIPFLLGTVLTPNRDLAMLLGTLVHLLNGWLFALLYAAAFESLRWTSWWLGAGFGLVHGLALLLVMMPLLPAVHPRMANERQGPTPTRQLQPPGFLALHYGRQTPLVSVLAHVVYGAILGGCYQLIA